MPMAEIDSIGNPEYTYIQVADAIAARIQAGQITRRLAESDLARQLGVAYQTVRDAIAILRERAVI